MKHIVLMLIATIAMTIGASARDLTVQEQNVYTSLATSYSANFNDYKLGSDFANSYIKAARTAASAPYFAAGTPGSARMKLAMDEAQAGAESRLANARYQVFLDWTDLVNWKKAIIAE